MTHEPSDKTNIEDIPMSDILTGTRWKLIGYTKEGSNELKAPDPSLDEIAHTLWFYSDTKMVGHSDINFIAGSYRAEKEDSHRIAFEIGDEGFISSAMTKALNNALTFFLSDNELKIKFGEKLHLLFQRLPDQRQIPSGITGITWIFTGFVDKKTGKIDSPKLNIGDLSYVLWLQKNSNLRIKSAANYIEGSYIMDPVIKKINPKISFTTQVGEDSYGEKFCKPFKGEFEYIVSKEYGLRIIEDNYYLQFQPFY